MKFQDIQKEFAEYIENADDADLTRFRVCGFWNIRHYLPYGVNTGLLRAARQFWDDNLNLFRFGQQELCPMIEEFSALMNFKHTRDTRIALPSEGPWLKDVIRQEIPLKETAYRRIFKNQGADLNETLKTIRSIGPKDRGWVPLMRLMILGCFLCEQPSGFCSYRLVSIVTQMMKLDASPYPVVLAETLIRLDKTKNGEREEGGSPLLLCMWLYEKLGVSSDYQGQKYNPKRISGRLKQGGPHQEIRFRAWDHRFRTLQEDQVRWQSPWLEIKEYLIKTGRPGILLYGMYRCLWCRPSRFARQYGYPQFPPNEEKAVGSTHTFSESFLSLVIEKGKKDFQYVIVDPRKPVPTIAGTDYKAWLSA